MPQRTADKQKHLGRGLESLLGPINSPTKKMGSLSESEHDNLNSFIDKTLHAGSNSIPIASIQINPYQARTHWDQGKLEELSSSIKANGIVQPIVVRRTDTGYELIAGERRIRASKMLGKDSIPALVREATDEQMLELSLVENIHRDDLNPIERAKAYENYVNTFGLSQTQAAEKLGEDRSVVCNHLRLLQLPKDLQDMLGDGRLGMGHARAILALPGEELKRKLANRALAGRLSVRDVERLVRQHTEQSPEKAPAKRGKAPHIAELEGKLSHHFGSRVKIETRKNGQRGHLVIEFKSIDEFDHVIDRLGVNCDDDI
ncbi:ParB/RepB/Spo0J family partition protein [Planctomycetota bacterium]